MTRLAGIVVLLASLLVQPAASEAPGIAAASASVTVASCSTAKHGVTRITWSTGRTTRHRNLTVQTLVFPGERTLLSSRPGKRSTVILACKAQKARVVVRTATRRYAFVVTAAPAAEPELPVDASPSPAAPAFLGVWDRPITLSIAAGVPATYRPELAAAAWNATLPADRQISVTYAPCPVGEFSCIPVEMVDFAGVAVADLPQGVQPAAAAWQGYHDGVMRSCRIGINPNPELTPVESHHPRVLTHEIGHCLGMPHWNTEGTSRWTLMTNGWGAQTVTDWDRAWLSAAYGA